MYIDSFIITQLPPFEKCVPHLVKYIWTMIDDDGQDNDEEGWPFPLLEYYLQSLEQYHLNDKIKWHYLPHDKMMVVEKKENVRKGEMKSVHQGGRVLIDQNAQ